MRRVSVIVLLALIGVSVMVARGDVSCEVLATQPACDVVLRPGPTEDTLRLVTVEGIDADPSSGELWLTTVAVEDDLGFAAWLRARTSEVVEAVPRAQIFPPGSDEGEVAERNAALMADSQLVATIAALTQLGFELTGEGALVAALTEDAVTDELAAGDVIVEVDGVTVQDNLDVIEAVRASRPGAGLRLTVDDDGDRRVVDVVLGDSAAEPGTPYIGLLLTTELELPIDVTIDAGVIGGPSAGLMFALSIVDLLGPDDLTGGAVIAGTGTVDRDGVVGAVGGVRQKLVGATTADGSEQTATVFLVPQANLAEARSASVGQEVLLVPVETLTDAITALEALRDGREPAGALALGPSR